MGLLFGWRGRVRRWPRLDPDRSPWDQGAGPGDIKVVSTEVLEHLMEKASKTPGVSATGRPEWLDVHRVDLRDHYIVVWRADGHGHYRCIVVSVLSDGPGGAYTLDVTERDFHALRDVSPNQLVELAHRYLSDVPMLPLDPRQQESWGRWGNSGERGVGPDSD
jgi:hypothetical protein